jgi:hypothetical protein
MSASASASGATSGEAGAQITLVTTVDGEHEAEETVKRSRFVAR